MTLSETRESFGVGNIYLNPFLAFIGPGRLGEIKTIYIKRGYQNIATFENIPVF
jgi:hypothetical protein